MKRFHLFFLTTVLTLFAAGCASKEETKPEPEPVKTLSVTPTSLHFDALGGIEVLEVTTNDEWSLETSDSWIKTSVVSNLITVTVAANIEGGGKAAKERNGSITVKTKGGKSATVTVKQDGEPIVFAVLGDKTEFTAEGGTLKVTVEYNVSYEVKAGADWITETPTKVTNIDYRIFTIAANTGDAREAEITFTPAEGTAQKVTVKQEKYVAPVIPGIEGTVTLTFPAKTQEAVSAYNKTWSAVNEQGAEFSIANFNNNNSGWAYIKGGNKTSESVATISTVSLLKSKILHVAVTVDAVTASSINKTELITASDPEFTKVVETLALDPAKGTMAYVLTKPAENLYYKLSYDCQKGSANGLIQISKVVYSTETYTPEPTPTPMSFADIIKAGAGNYLSNEALVVAVGNTNTVVTDGTGYMFIYDKDKVCKVGDKVVLDGAVTIYNGCFEWNNPSIAVKSQGSTVEHPSATALDEAAITAYAAAPAVVYATAKGTKTGYILKVGEKEINVYSNETLADGDYEIFGYTIGYNSSKSQVNLVCTSAKPIEQPAGNTISNADEFIDFMTNKAASATQEDEWVLTADIDLAGKSWTAPAFSGIFDGRNFKIKNWKNEMRSAFGTVTGTVKNLVIDSSCELTLNGNANSAILVSQNQGTISGCINNAAVNVTVTTASTTRHTGVLVAINRALVENCVNNGNVSLKAEKATGQYRCAGIVGSNANSGSMIPCIKNCVNNGNFIFEQLAEENAGDKYIAGIAAVLDSTAESVIEGCVNNGKIYAFCALGTSPKLYPGGIVGLQKGGKILNCINFGEVGTNSTSENSHCGGLAATTKADTKKQPEGIVTMEGCAVNCTVSGNAQSCGLVYGCSYSGDAELPETFGTAAAPIKVAGTVNGTAATADNYTTLLRGTAAVNEKHVVNAVYQAVTK